MAATPPQGQLGGIALIAAGFILVACTLGGYALGYLIDVRAHTQPWASVIGLMLGFITGMWDLYRIAIRVSMSQPFSSSPPAGEQPKNTTEPEGNHEQNHEETD